MRLNLPEQNKQSVYARMRAERERIARQYRAEGEEQALEHPRRCRPAEGRDPLRRVQRGRENSRRGRCRIHPHLRPGLFQKSAFLQAAAHARSLQENIGRQDHRHAQHRFRAVENLHERRGRRQVSSAAQARILEWSGPLPGPRNGLAVRIAAAAAGLWLLSGIYIVPPTEQAVVTRFGAVVERRVYPGIHYSLPWPVDRVYRAKVNQLQRLVIGGDPADSVLGRTQPLASQFLTGDQNIIHMRVAVQYSVGDSRRFPFPFRGCRQDHRFRRGIRACPPRGSARRGCGAHHRAGRHPGRSAGRGAGAPERLRRRRQALHHQH